MVILENSAMRVVECNADKCTYLLHQEPDGMSCNFVLHKLLLLCFCILQQDDTSIRELHDLEAIEGLVNKMGAVGMRAIDIIQSI